MDALSARVAAAGAVLRSAWHGLEMDGLHLSALGLALLVLGALAAAAIAAAIARRVLSAPGRTGVALPALLAWARSSPLALVRHGALALFLAGVPFFAVALADPQSTLTREEVTHPGRRIALLIDASSSMIAPFTARSLTLNAPIDATFFVSVAAAEEFIRRRMEGPYRDLMALIEFGDEAYVITPFTSDHRNVLLSLSLIGDWTEWMSFPDQGTTIARAIDQSVALYKAFDFLDAAGNLMVIFSDGDDAQVAAGGRTVIDVVEGAREAGIPVYFIRTAANQAMGQMLPDAMWRAAVERTGGRFYAAADEGAIVRAIEEIDRASAGAIAVRQYATREPRYAPFALVAALLWTAALALKLNVPWFNRFP
jgi:Ca-activated chloride channel family protein